MSRRTKHYAPCCKWRIKFEQGVFKIYHWYAIEKNTLSQWHLCEESFLSEKKAKQFIIDSVGVHL